MGDFFELNCDKMPNPSGNKQSWHLPANLTKHAVYKMYCTWLEEHQDAGPPVSHNTFLLHWRLRFSHVSIPARSRFKQCGTYVCQLVCSLFLLPRCSFHLSFT